MAATGRQSIANTAIVGDNHVMEMFIAVVAGVLVALWLRGVWQRNFSLPPGMHWDRETGCYQYSHRDDNHNWNDIINSASDGRVEQ